MSPPLLGQIGQCHGCGREHEYDYDYESQQEEEEEEEEEEEKRGEGDGLPTVRPLGISTPRRLGAGFEAVFLCPSSVFP